MRRRFVRVWAGGIPPPFPYKGKGGGNPRTGRGWKEGWKGKPDQLFQVLFKKYFEYLTQLYFNCENLYKCAFTFNLGVWSRSPTTTFQNLGEALHKLRVKCGDRHSSKGDPRLLSGRSACVFPKWVPPLQRRRGSWVAHGRRAHHAASSALMR